MKRKVRRPTRMLIPRLVLHLRQGADIGPGAVASSGELSGGDDRRFFHRYESGIKYLKTRAEIEGTISRTALAKIARPTSRR